MMEGISTINSFLRTLLAHGRCRRRRELPGWYGYTTYNAKEIEARKQVNCGKTRSRDSPMPRTASRGRGEMASKQERVEGQGQRDRASSTQREKAGSWRCAT